MQKSIDSEKNPYQGLIFSCALGSDMAILDELKSKHKLLVINTLESQIQDLLPCLFTSDFFSRTPLEELKSKWLNGRSIEEVGNWVYYPWKNMIVRVLDKEDFILCRTNRNRLKISNDNQLSLSNKTVLFIGP